MPSSEHALDALVCVPLDVHHLAALLLERRPCPRTQLDGVLRPQHCPVQAIDQLLEDHPRDGDHLLAAAAAANRRHDPSAAAAPRIAERLPGPLPCPLMIRVRLSLPLLLSLLLPLLLDLLRRDLAGHDGRHLAVVVDLFARMVPVERGLAQVVLEELPAMRFAVVGGAMLAAIPGRLRALLHERARLDVPARLRRHCERSREARPRKGRRCRLQVALPLDEETAADQSNKRQLESGKPLTESGKPLATHCIERRTACNTLYTIYGKRETACNTLYRAAYRCIKDGTRCLLFTESGKTTHCIERRAA